MGKSARYLPWLSGAFVLMLTSALYAISPNPLLSRGKTVYSNLSGASVLNDGRYDRGYGTAVTVSSGSWVAFDIGSGPEKLLVSWNAGTQNYEDGNIVPGVCVENMSVVSGYAIATSSNSTDGSDGDWTVGVTVSDNKVSARASSVVFKGKSWVKITFTGGTMALNEVEAFDLSSGDDTWIFMGNSITSAAFKPGEDVVTFAERVNAAAPSYFPAMVRAGMPCIKASQVAPHIDFYLQNNPDIHYWGIELGTNDAWGGGANGLDGFRNALVTIIKALKAAGKEPVLVRLPYVNSTWALDRAYLDCIDSLAQAYGLVPGPDLYSYFQSHAGEQTDGVHPNATGAASIQRIWAEKMLSTLYSGTPQARAIRLSAASASDSSIALSWTDNGISSSYRVMRAPAEAGAFSEIAKVAAKSYLDAGLMPATKYYYKIAASDTASESPVVAATTVAVAAPVGKAIYTDSVSLCTKGWVDKGGSMLAEAQTGAYEGVKAWSFNAKIAAGWAGFGLSFNNYGTVLDATGYGFLHFAYKTSGATNGIRVGLGYSDSTETGTDGYTIPAAAAWAPIDIPLSHFTAKGYPLGGINVLNFILGGNDGAGTFMIDDIRLVSAPAPVKSRIPAKPFDASALYATVAGKRLSVYGMNQGTVLVYDAAGRLAARTFLGKARTAFVTVREAGVYVIRQGSRTTTAIVP
jgi:hypothetical protein